MSQKNAENSWNAKMSNLNFLKEAMTESNLSQISERDSCLFWLHYGKRKMNMFWQVEKFMEKET